MKVDIVERVQYVKNREKSRHHVVFDGEAVLGPTIALADLAPREQILAQILHDVKLEDKEGSVGRILVVACIIRNGNGTAPSLVLCIGDDVSTIVAAKHNISVDLQGCNLEVFGETSTITVRQAVYDVLVHYYLSLECELCRLRDLRVAMSPPEPW